MKPKDKIELIFSENKKIVAIQDVSDWTLTEIVKMIKFSNLYYPERDYRIERKVDNSWVKNRAMFYEEANWYDGPKKMKEQIKRKEKNREIKRSRKNS